MYNFEKKAMEDQNENPLEENRKQLLDLLTHKSSLKQDIADDCEKVFDLLKQSIKKEIEELQRTINDQRVRLSFHEKGKFEIHAYVGSDVLVFNLHNNVFKMPEYNPLWGTSYFNSDENKGFFGIIHTFNFLAESFEQNRIEDRGYLISRIFVNKERHFMIEGKGQLGSYFRDPQNMMLTEDVLKIIVQMSFAHALQFDLYIPPFDFMDELSVAQIQNIGESLKIQTGKRLGFKMRAEDTEIF
jgi:hypothetical protein